jgi:hypothetical protein
LRIPQTNRIAEIGNLNAMVIADAAGAPAPDGAGQLGHVHGLLTVKRQTA